VPNVGGSDQVDDDDDLRIHRGVDLGQLGELVSGLDQIEPEYVPALVDVVLDRATRRVATPTRYVAAALRADFEGILDSAAARWPVHSLAPEMGPHGAALGTAHATPKAPGLPAIPCTNPDHDGIYNPADCPQCRLESRIAHPAPEAQPAELTAEQIEGLPVSLRRRIGA